MPTMQSKHRYVLGVQRRNKYILGYNMGSKWIHTMRRNLQQLYRIGSQTYGKTKTHARARRRATNRHTGLNQLLNTIHWPNTTRWHGRVDIKRSPWRKTTEDLLEGVRSGCRNQIQQMVNSRLQEKQRHAKRRQNSEVPGRNMRVNNRSKSGVYSNLSGMYTKRKRRKPNIR